MVSRAGDTWAMWQQAMVSQGRHNLTITGKLNKIQTELSHLMGPFHLRIRSDNQGLLGPQHCVGASFLRKWVGWGREDEIDYIYVQDNGTKYRQNLLVLCCLLFLLFSVTSEKLDLWFTITFILWGKKKIGSTRAPTKPKVLLT